jgi:hypothetical protein
MQEGTFLPKKAHSSTQASSKPVCHSLAVIVMSHVSGEESSWEPKARSSDKEGATELLKGEVGEEIRSQVQGLGPCLVCIGPWVLPQTIEGRKEGRKMRQENPSISFAGLLTLNSMGEWLKSRKKTEVTAFEVNVLGDFKQDENYWLCDPRKLVNLSVQSVRSVKWGNKHK